MRRKSTRAAAKASPEKPKEEKTPKKARRHSKRHKPTSSESESEGEVSVSSNETPAQVGGELWTVTQTEQSTNDIGKIKICLARPSPATPERIERVSKRLRNKPAVNMEDSPPEEKPVRRTRRSRGGSSPAKKDELPQPPPPPPQQQQEQEEVCEEKKGKGKSKGKHKSKIVEQAAHIDDEPTEMQSEISENVQVTAQSPQNQNVDNSDAECVEDANSVCKSGEEQALDNQDTNDNIVDAAHNDISNNNVANENLPAEEQSNDANDDNADNTDNIEQNNSPSPTEVVCNVSVAQSEKSLLEDEDVSMKEVTHFEINESKGEETETELPKEETKDTIIEESKVKLQEALKTEVLVENEVKLATEVKDESRSGEDSDVPLQTLQEDIKKVKEEVVNNEEVKPQIQPELEMKSESSVVAEEKCKIEVNEQQVNTDSIEYEETKVEEKVEKEEDTETASPEKEEIQPEVNEESDTKETAEESHEQQVEEAEKEMEEGQKEKSPEPEPEVESETKRPSRSNRRLEKGHDDAPAAEERVTTPTPTPEEDAEGEESTPEVPRESQVPATTETSEIRAEEIKEAEPEKEPRTPLPWGESTSTPNILILTSSKLLEIYPTLMLLDEASVKLDSTPRERPQKTKSAAKTVERRVSQKEEPPAPKLEHQDSTTSTNTDASSIALNRKISIVEDEASSLRPPPSPAQHEKSAVLFITNLVRPFTVKQLRGLLERTGKIVDEGFWTDKIKSKCYVQYETDEEAEVTRNAIHGVLWPIGNGKKLIIDFATVEDLEKAKSPPVVVPPPVVAKPEPEKENHEPPPKKLPTLEDENKPEVKSQHDWDEKDARMRRGRSASVDVKRRYSQSRRSRSPSEEIKKKRREEPVQQRAMDDLFRKTEAMPSIYWQPLQPEEIALKQQQRLERMEAHKRKMESQQTRQRRNSDRQRGGPYRRRY